MKPVISISFPAVLHGWAIHSPGSRANVNEIVR